MIRLLKVVLKGTKVKELKGERLMDKDFDASANHLLKVRYFRCDSSCFYFFHLKMNTLDKSSGLFL